MWVLSEFPADIFKNLFFSTGQIKAQTSIKKTACC